MGQLTKLTRRSVHDREHLRGPLKRRSAEMRARIESRFVFPESYAFEKKVLRIWYFYATGKILYTTGEVEDPRFFHDFQVLFSHC